MTGLGGNPCSFQAGRAAARNDNPSRFRSGRAQRAPLGLASEARIDGARDTSRVPTAVLDDADARSNAVGPAGARLLHPLGIGEQPAADGDEIGLARGERSLGEVGQPDPPGNHHRNVDELLDGLREPQGEPLVPTRVLDVRPSLPDRDREVVDGRGALERIDDLQRVVERQPTGRLLVGTQARPDHEVRSTAGADLLDDLDQEARTPLERVSAVRVAATVRRGREELPHEVAVRGVHLGPVHSRRGVVGSGAPEGLDDHPDVRRSHLVRHDGIPRRGDRRRRHGNRLGLTAGGLPPEVDQLPEHQGAVPVDGVCPNAKGVDDRLVPGFDQDPGREAGRGVDGRPPEDDQADAGGGALLLDSQVARTDPAVLREPRPHRRLDDAVADRAPADRAGLEEVRIGRGHTAVAQLRSNRPAPVMTSQPFARPSFRGEGFQRGFN